MTNFADFADFLSMKALKMNSAYYKAIFTTPKYQSCDWFGKGRSFNDVTPSLQKLSRKAEFARSRSKKVSECVCYGKKHYLHVCEEFCRKTFADKKRFVCTKRLCFRCLKGGHMIKECRSSKLTPSRHVATLTTNLLSRIRHQLVVPQVGILMCTLIKRQVHVLVLIYIRFVCAMVVKKY